jgi:hypothetical protein
VFARRRLGHRRRRRLADHLTRTGAGSGPSAFQQNRLLSRTWTPTLAAWSHLSEALTDDVRTFGRPVEASAGETFWEAMNLNPAVLSTFNAQMAGRGRDQARSLLEATDVGEIGLVIDVGAGKGATLAALLPEVPGVRGVVADRAEVVPEAQQTIAQHGLADRCEAVASDFFDAVPAGGDAYVLGNILHDWPDDRCRQILGVVRAAMRPRSRLWIHEQVLDPAPPRTPQAQADVHLLDLHMLVLFGGMERTRAEYAALLAASGFAEPTCASTSTQWDVLEARAV